MSQGRKGYWVVGGKHAGKGPFYGSGQEDGGSAKCCCVFLVIIMIVIIIALIF